MVGFDICRLISILGDFDWNPDHAHGDVMNGPYGPYSAQNPYGSGGEDIPSSVFITIMILVFMTLWIFVGYYVFAPERPPRLDQPAHCEIQNFGELE